MHRLRHLLAKLTVFHCYKEYYFQCKVVEYIFFLLALQPPIGVVFYSPLAGFSLLAYEVS